MPNLILVRYMIGRLVGRQRRTDSKIYVGKYVSLVLYNDHDKLGRSFNIQTKNNLGKKLIVWNMNLFWRFSMEHVLSEPSSQWTGRKDHIGLTLLQSYLPIQSKDIPNTHYVCICGPTSFTQSTERYSLSYFCLLYYIV